jgi:pimeloyl-ACP methyl ester carboxylesterase
MIRPCSARSQLRCWVLLGSDTKPYATRSARHVADHVASARVHEIPGAGHASPLTHPEALAEALIEFFAPAQQRT